RLTVKFTMLGVRFLDVDFMQINFAYASPSVYVIRIYCTVNIRADALSTEGKQPRPNTFRPRLRNDLLSSYSGDAGHPPIGGLLDCPPGRGDFSVSNFHPGLIPGNLVRNDFWR